MGKIPDFPKISPKLSQKFGDCPKKIPDFPKIVPKVWEFPKIFLTCQRFRSGQQTSIMYLRSGQIQVRSIASTGTLSRYFLLRTGTLCIPPPDAVTVFPSSFTLGCGGGNINSAQRSNEEIRSTNWFPVSVTICTKIFYHSLKKLETNLYHGFLHCFVELSFNTRQACPMCLKDGRSPPHARHPGVKLDRARSAARQTQCFGTESPSTSQRPGFRHRV